MRIDPGKLKATRKLRGLSQVALAARAGVSRFPIAAVESGRQTRMRPSSLRKLTEALGCTVADIAVAETDEERAALAREKERADATA